MLLTSLQILLQFLYLPLPPITGRIPEIQILPTILAFSSLTNALNLPTIAVVPSLAASFVLTHRGDTPSSSSPSVLYTLSCRSSSRSNPLCRSPRLFSSHPATPQTCSPCSPVFCLLYLHQACIQMRVTAFKCKCKCAKR